jgi:hypothetical protein
LREPALRQIGQRYPVIIINGCDSLTGKNGKQFLADLSHVIEGQKLCRVPSLIHMEISRVGDFLHELFINRNGELPTVRVKSLGLSDGDLPAVYHELLKNPDQLARINSPIIKDLESIKDQPVLALRVAKQIMQALGLERIHVHSGSQIKLDIVLRTDLNQKPFTKARHELYSEVIAGA